MIARSKEGRVLLVVGLGNPGEKYKNTYHSAGAIFADYLASALDALPAKKMRVFEYRKAGKFTIVKPLVYMNESGAAVASALKYFKISPTSTLVAHDDSDIPLGSFKLSFDRGAAGHRGVESIIGTFKAKNFYRLRIGVRPHRETVRKKAGDFVLKPITSTDRKVLEKVFEKAARKILNKPQIQNPNIK
jgi:PTH1 family peptidyl-tRNA hydrolase